MGLELLLGRNNKKNFLRNFSQLVRLINIEGLLLALPNNPMNLFMKHGKDLGT